MAFFGGFGLLEQGTAQGRERRFDFAPLPFFCQGLEDGPDIAGGAEVIAAIARQVLEPNQPPGHQLLQSHADVRTRHAELLGDVVGMQGAVGNEDQRVDLADGAIDAPAAAHFAEVQDEALGQGWQVHFRNFRNY